jgi:type IV pilus assembly protein PilE
MYKDAMRKSRRGSAQAAMADLAQREAAYFLDRRAYAVGSGALTTIGYTTPADVALWYGFAVSEVAGGAPDFIITATPAAGTDQEVDGVLVLTSDGTKTRDGSASKW